jgi:hypothetical protein
MSTSPIHPQETLHRTIWTRAIRSNENRAMIGPGSVFALLRVARSNEAASCICLFAAADRSIFVRLMRHHSVGTVRLGLSISYRRSRVLFPK